MINIGSRRECFFDTFLIDEGKTTAERRLHKPVRREVLLTMDIVRIAGKERNKILYEKNPEA